MDVDQRKKLCIVGIVFCLVRVVFCTTDPNDFKVLNNFRNGLENPELLNWPAQGKDPCGPPSWPHVFCSKSRVTQIQVQGLGLKGPLPQDLNSLVKLQNVGFQKNNFNGNLPTFSGLSDLQYAFLDFNEFDSIPSDFFHGLNSVRVLALDHNPFNVSTGWSIPNELQDSAQLTNFSCSSCNIIGPMPEFFGTLPSLTSLRLSYNRFYGEIPVSFSGSMLQILWLNDQDEGGMTGPIDVIGTMLGLTQVWLHGNSFTGSIPDSIGVLTSLRELNLNRNQLTGLIPQSLANLSLQLLDLNNNMLMGPIPKFKAANVSYSSNSFCQTDPGEICSPQVNALLEFLRPINYPAILASQWSGNDPCRGPWWGITCNPLGQVSVINLQKLKLNGSLSPSLVDLDSLLQVNLGRNNLSGRVPTNITQLNSLRLLDLSGNNFLPPLPKFRDGIKIITDGNPQLGSNMLEGSPSSATGRLAPSPTISQPRSPQSPTSDYISSGQAPSSPTSGSKSPISINPESKIVKKSNVVVIVAAASASAISVLLGILVSVCCVKKRTDANKAHGAVVIHPRDPRESDNVVKIAVSNNMTGSTQTGSSSESRNSSGMESAHVIEDGNLVISVQVLRRATNNFAPENELGRGGFGAVYKGELDGGTKIAVKRMEVGVIGSKALDEFESEIAVLSKVRHRHLVSLLGYSIEGNERLLVYEYMAQGALSRHLFYWKSLKVEPLSWTSRLTIALDVARGMEYLHSLAHQSFIHRDLKSSNILLGDEFRAKVSDFGLVKLAPDRERSVATRLAGTFGYLAPEYAVTGKVTTKADVFSFGVVLMELLTGLVALDEQRSEESRYLADWFWKIKSSREGLTAAIDPVIDAKQETIDSICIIAELAGHCTARDPYHRPDMGHAVNVLTPLVEKWKPFDEQMEEYSGIDYTLPLPEMVKDWQQEGETKDFDGTRLEDSKGSIPARPVGFADSFTSADAR